MDNSALHESFPKIASKPAENVPFHDEDVIYIGCLISIFGHAITDNLKKLWFLKTQECQELINAGAKVVYLSYGNKKLSSYVMHIIKLAGIDVSLFHEISEVAQYRNVIVPDNSMILSNGKRYHTKIFKETIETIINSCSEYKNEVYDKVYLSRSLLNDHKDFGEFRVEKEFEKHGYKIIHPEILPFEEQVKIVNCCKCFAATVGSVSHLSIFCRQGTKVCLLMKARYINEYQCMMDDMNSVDVTYVDVSHTLGGKDVWKGPFYLSRTKYLGRHFNKWYIDIPVLDKIYYAYLFNKMKQKVMTLYSDLLSRCKWIKNVRTTIRQLCSL